MHSWIKYIVLTSRCLGLPSLYCQVNFLIYIIFLKHSELREGVEQDPVTQKVRCLVCLEGDPHKEGIWIAKTLLSKHLTSDAHLTEIQQKAEQEKLSAAQNQRLQKTYAGEMVYLTGHIPDPKPRMQPGIFDFPVDTSDSFTLHPSDVAEGSSQWNGPIIPAYISLIIRDSSIEAKHLCHQFQQMLLQAEHKDEFGHDLD